MAKTCLLFFCCFIATHSFCQAVINKDSTAKVDTFSAATKKLPANTATKASLKIYPNPAKNKISLAVTGFETGLATVKIIDSKGKIVREDNRLLTNGTDEINMFLQLQPGVYFISLSEKTKVVKKKLVVL